MRREEACRRQAYKQKETPKETKEFLRREEACRRQAYKPKEIPKETRVFEEGKGLPNAGLQTKRDTKP